MQATGSQTFGAYLAERLRESRLSARKAGAAIGLDGRYISFLVRNERTPSYATVKRLSDLLQFPLQRGLTLAGVPDEREPVGPDATLHDWTVFELLADVADRYRALQAQTQAANSLPPATLTDEQFEARGELVARLDALAGVATAAGDTVAADAVRSLAQRLNDQMAALESDAANAADRQV